MPWSCMACTYLRWRCTGWGMQHAEHQHAGSGDPVRRSGEHMGHAHAGPTPRDGYPSHWSLDTLPRPAAAQARDCGDTQGKHTNPCRCKHDLQSAGDEGGGATEMRGTRCWLLPAHQRKLDITWTRVPITAGGGGGGGKTWQQGCALQCRWWWLDTTSSNYPFHNKQHGMVCVEGPRATGHGKLTNKERTRMTH